MYHICLKNKHILVVFNFCDVLIKYHYIEPNSLEILYNRFFLQASYFHGETLVRKIKNFCEFPKIK